MHVFLRPRLGKSLNYQESFAKWEWDFVNLAMVGSENKK